MSGPPDPISGHVGEIAWELRPEWLAGRYWWRIYVAGHPRVLVFHAEHGVVAAEALAADELQYRRDTGKPA